MKTVQWMMCLICLVCAGTASAGSNPKVDSLFRVLDSEIPGDKAEVLWRIAYELFDVDNVQALFYAERAYEEVWKRGDSLQIVKVGTTYGQLLRRVDRIQESIDVCSRMLGIARRHDFQKYVKILLNTLGVIFAFNGEYSLAMEYHLASLDMRRKDGSVNEIVVTLQNIGILYYKIGDVALAMKYYESALDLLARERIEVDPMLFANIGFSFIDLNEYDSALSYFARVVPKDQLTLLVAEMGKGQSLAQMAEDSKAIAQLTKALDLARELGSLRFQTLSLIFLGKIAHNQRRLDAAKAYLNEAFLVHGLDDPTVMLEYLKQRSLLAHSLGDARGAYDFLRHYLAVRDSVDNSFEANRLRRFHALHDEKESRARFDDQNRILALNSNLLVKQRWLLFLSILVAILCVGVALVLYKSNLAKNRINRQLDERVHERTIELSRHRDALQHAYDEQSLIRKRVSAEILSAVASLKGIFFVGEKDLPEEYQPYLRQTKVTAEQIEEVINRFKSHANSSPLR